jgi:hypothetical protein
MKPSIVIFLDKTTGLSSKVFQVFTSGMFSVIVGREIKLFTPEAKKR